MPLFKASPPHLRGLLPPQGHLRRHHPLSLHHQQTVGALAVPPAAEALVPLQARHHAVVAAPSALGRPAQLPLVPGTQAAGTRLVVALAAAVGVVLGRAGAGRGGIRQVVALRLQAFHVDLKLTTGVV